MLIYVYLKEFSQYFIILIFVCLYSYKVEGTTNNALINDILNKAGPHHIYHLPSSYNRPSTASVNNVTYVTTEITHEPAVYNSVHYAINEDSDPGIIYTDNSLNCE